MEHSPQFEHLKERYDQGRLRISLLRGYVKTGAITEEELEEITGQKYQSLTTEPI